MFNYCRLTVSVSDVKSPYLRVSESFWRASHTLRTSSQIMIRDRPTNLMCCWHLHRGKRRELEYGTARLANSITGVLASVDVAIGLCTMWRAMVEHAPDDRMPSRFKLQRPSKVEHRTGRRVLLQQMLAFPQASPAGLHYWRSSDWSSKVNLALPGHQPVRGAISSSPACENQRGSQDTL